MNSPIDFAIKEMLKWRMQFSKCIYKDNADYCNDLLYLGHVSMLFSNRILSLTMAVDYRN